MPFDDIIADITPAPYAATLPLAIYANIVITLLPEGAMITLLTPLIIIAMPLRYALRFRH